MVMRAQTQTSEGQHAEGFKRGTPFILRDERLTLKKHFFKKAVIAEFPTIYTLLQ